MSFEEQTTVDWSMQIALIRTRFQELLRSGETLVSMDPWLEQVPEHLRSQLRDELEVCRRAVDPAAVETRVLSSDAVLGGQTEVPTARDPFDCRKAVRVCRTFQGLAEEAADALEAALEPQAFDQGTVLLEQGDMARGLYLILGGAVDILDAATGECIDCDGAGSVLGEMSLLTGQPCSARVVATTKVEALVLSSTRYRELTLKHPELEIALSQLVSDRLGGRRHDALCGKQIGHFLLTDCINRGGMGVVYRATDVKSDERVALKMLRHRFIYDEQMIGRFDQEAGLLRDLIHPNIVSFREHFLAFRTRFLVLDLCDGADLFRVLHKHGSFDEATTRAVLGQIARGLMYAHDCGVVHRDLKPGNVLVDRCGDVKLTDFGLSKLIESEVIEGRAVGTPSYMPPEQFRQSDVGKPCDWYALGCLAYEMMSGEILFIGKNWSDIYETKRRLVPNQHWPLLDASEELKAVIRGALHPRAALRTIDLEKMADWAEPVGHLFRGE